MSELKISAELKRTVYLRNQNTVFSLVNVKREIFYRHIKTCKSAVDTMIEKSSGKTIKHIFKMLKY